MKSKVTSLSVKQCFFWAVINNEAVLDNVVVMENRENSERDCVREPSDCVRNNITSAMSSHPAPPSSEVDQLRKELG